MNIIVENFLKEIKSKQLKDWHVMELEDFCFAIQYLYKYLDKKDKDEKKVLKDVYNKIADWVNSGKRGTVINPGHLNKLDKEHE